MLFEREQSALLDMLISLFRIMKLTRRLQEIDSTVGIMRDNINKVSERGARLDSLQDKTDNLAVSAQGFRRGANRVRKQVSYPLVYQHK